VRVLVSLTERDRPVVGAEYGAGEDPLRAFRRALSEVGLTTRDCRLATPADVADLDSSWAKRLGVPSRRPAWRLVARRP
jgi:hypothetical protein